jgi:hypothetical protein
MRLLYYRYKGSELALLRNLIHDDEIPYAMLSYTWDAGQEITFSGLMKNSEEGKTAYDKIRFCALQAKRDVLHYFWIDTYCVDKGSSVELFEAMNSLLHYYPEAAECLNSLPDVPSDIGMEMNR